jgi:peptidyl-prolyl cis-trans isomerase SurA
MRRKILIGAMLLAAKWGMGESITIDGVAAFVNDGVVTVGEVKEAMGPMLPQLRQLYTGADLESQQQELYADILDDLINAKLILKAYDADTKLNKDGIEKYVEKRVSEFIQERYSGDRQEFLKNLRGAHMSMEEWRRQMRERIVVGMMKSREVDAQVMISPRDVRRIYEENPKKYTREAKVKIRVILILGSTNEASRVVGEKAAADTLLKIRTGADFATVAREISEDGKAKDGGDWGWYDIRDLRPELAVPVKALQKNMVSEVIRVDGNYYLVKLEDSLAAGPIPFEEVRSSIEKDLRKKEIRRVTDGWMTRLRKDAYIEIIKTSQP